MRFKGTFLVGWALPTLLCFWLPALSQIVTHGPVVGAVTSVSARILVRVDVQATVSFDLDTDSAFTNPITTESAVAEQELDYFAIASVEGLLPDTRYYYRAVINGEPQQGLCQFMTFPTPGTVTTFTFAFGSCQQADDDPNSHIGRVFPLIVRDARPRFFLHLGDWGYPDITYEATPAYSGTTDVFNADFSRVQASYRTKYDPTYPMDELFKVTPVDYVYDDHDYTANNSDMTFPARENSLRGYQTMFPHYPLANASNGLWHKFTFGNADFFVLDTRTQRHPNMAAFKSSDDGTLVFEPGPDHLILQGDPAISGELQMDWLIRELRESTATWKFICTSVAFNPGHRAAMEFALSLQGGSENGGSETPGITPLFTAIAVALSDGWDGFPASVQRLIAAVHEAGIQNVIMLSADSHTAAIDDGAHSLFPEFMAGGLDRTNSRVVALMEQFGLHLWNRGGQTLDRDNFNSHYGRVSVFGDDSVKFDIIDEFGELIASYTQPAGHLVSAVGLEVAPEERDFGEVETGKTADHPILLINTGADPVEVRQINISNPAFALPPGIRMPFIIPPGMRTDLDVLFQPRRPGEQVALLTIESNDPESPFTVSLKGKGTGIPVEKPDFSFSMSLEPGLNMISLPLKPDVPYTARSFAEKLSATVVIRFDSVQKRFVGFCLNAPDDGFPIEGGKGYIVNVPDGGVVEFTGAPWTNENDPFSRSPAPPPPCSLAPSLPSAWAFVVSGYVLDSGMLSARHGDCTVTVKNLRTGATVTEAVEPSGYFAVAYADLSRNAVVEIRDTLESVFWVGKSGFAKQKATVALANDSGNIVSGPFVHEVTLESIRNAVLNVRLKLGHIIPNRSVLLQNYPNPFNPETWIPYHLKDAAHVCIRIYNTNGQLIRTLDLGYKDAGIYVSQSEAAYWDGRNESGEEVASGIYFYRITADDFSAERKMAAKK